ncbi:MULTISPECIES: class I SAM-dependent methyltransferase [unclassified Sphingomonas]|uniref:class I SAM-dependent methyltransferase n=1 Tax=unclassified Sphingomonas TaxID=196159 RepID=UPI000E103AD4|nr:methyltransferase domain-containing protein [Sphingomonas sp. FARSPH]AXJ97111.1 class I SAM-dependent methyltransferase [Sphingomonas sp. FARSPH]
MTDHFDWTGRVGDVWAQEWQRTDRAFAGLAPRLDAAILAAAPAGPFTALDIGCGAGATAAALAGARLDARVTGVDLSAALLDVARTRHAALPNLAFRHGDAITTAGALAPLDLAVSRHGVMFFDDPVAAFARLRQAMAPGGAVVFSCFAPVADNPWACLLAPPAPPAPHYTPGPFAFGDPDRVAAILAAAGWAGVTPTRVAFAYRVGASDDPVADAIGFLTRIGPAARLLHDSAPADRAALLARLADRLAAQRNGSTIDFPAAAWLWTARATGELP